MARSGVMIGLMSGTSADGVDACVARLALRARAGRPRLEHEIIHFETRPYRDDLRAAVLAAATVEDVCRLNFAVAEAFAEAALSALDASGVKRSEVAAVASHGQTLFHAPRAAPVGGYASRSTLQVGDISVIAARTGLVTVGDFRTKDMALGGQGAPLVPWVDWLLTDAAGAAWLNIGGIANVTFVAPGAGAAEVAAFDTGPGNTLIDRVVRGASGGKHLYDEGGRLALSGRVDEEALGRMMTHEYFARGAPKSTGPEEFGAGFLGRFGVPERLEDACATLAALTADTIAAAIGRGRFARVIASGGGISNRAIMGRLARRIEGTPVVDSGAAGVPPEAKEAFAFAVLGLATLARMPANLPCATGASRPAVLGKTASPE